jgi:hypothetical protein
MRPTILVMLLVLAGCGQTVAEAARDACSREGYAPDTADYADCVQQETARRAAQEPQRSVSGGGGY